MIIQPLEIRLMPLVYVVCPKCGRDIRHGFSRGSPPFMYTHPRRETRAEADCRLIIILDPDGDAHRVIVVPHERRMEDVLAAYLSSKAGR